MLEIIAIVVFFAACFFIKEIHRGYKGRTSVISVVICSLLLCVFGAFMTIFAFLDLDKRGNIPMFVFSFIIGLPCLLIGLGLFIKF